MSDKTTEEIYKELETPVIRCKDCGGTVIYKRTIEGFEIIHSCANGKQVRKQIATAERRGAEKALEIADVGCFILHPRGTCKQCDAWRYARGEAAGPEGRNG